MTQASVEVCTNRRWHANPRLGELIVYLDGRNVGRLPRPGRLLVPCESGDHTLRIRQWWYLSTRLPLALGEGEQVTIEADFACRDSLPRRFLRFMFVPWRAWSLSTQHKKRKGTRLGERPLT